MVTQLRRLPAGVLLVVLALLPVEAWTRVGDGRLITRHAADGIERVSFVAAVAPDGRIAVSITYRLEDAAERTLSIRLPDGARHLTVAGAPLAASIGKYADVVVQGTTTVGYEIPDAVVRYEDGALLQFLRTTDNGVDGDAALFPCPRCYLTPSGFGDLPVDGALHAGGADAVRLLFVGLDPVRSAADPLTVRFAGIDGGADAVSLVAVLPQEAVPAVAISDGSVEDAIARIRSDLHEAGESFSSPADGGSDRLAVAVVLSAMLAGLGAWIAWRFHRVRSDRIAAHDDSIVPTGVEGAFTKPSTLEPALAGLVVGEVGSGPRSAVAGTLLELARRDVITIDGIDSRRFTLTVPSGATGSSPVEEAVLARLRPQGQLAASATITGPPLWGPDGPRVARALRRVVLREGLKRRLVRFTLSALVLVPASIAMGVVALVGSSGISPLGWFAVVAGPVLAVVAALLTGVRLTGAGQEERRRWLVYADWLRSNTQLADVGAPGVAIWGEVLPHAAALGAAPRAAEDLSPRGGS